MNEHQIFFTDASGVRWSLTALPEGKTRFLLEHMSAGGICIAAESALLTLDESANEAPFVLELDDNCTLTLTNESLEALDEFLQANEVAV